MKSTKTVLALSLASLLTACAHATKGGHLTGGSVDETTTVTTTAFGHRTSGPTPYNVTPSQHQIMLKTLRKQGVIVISQGDKLRLVLPVNRFFTPGTRDLKESKVMALRQIADVAKSYGIARIQVYGFTSDIGSMATRAKRSKQYADVVAAFLWDNNIPRSQVSVKGLGSKYAISSNNTPKGSLQNQRVELRINYKPL